MWHLDEGDLHGYLDALPAERHGGTAAQRQRVDQHLTACAECRGRLEEVRRVRDRASSLLRAASPGDIAAPPFEQLRAGRRGHPAAIRRSFLRPLAWAATAALALTVGWYVQGISLRREAYPLATAPEIEARESDANVAARDQVAGAASGAVASREAPNAGQPLAVAAPKAGTAEPSPTLAVEEAGARREADELPRAAPAQMEKVPAAAAPARPEAQSNVKPVAPRIARAIVRADTDSGWTMVTAEEAARRLGGPVAVVGGLAVTRFDVREEGDDVVLRVTQRLDSGGMVELTQRPSAMEQPDRRERAAVAESLRRVTGTQPSAAGAAAAAVPAAAALEATAGTDWRGYRVMIAGPLPVDSLRVLLARLRAK